MCEKSCVRGVSRSQPCNPAAPSVIVTDAERPPRPLLLAVQDALQLALAGEQPHDPLEPEPHVAAVQEPPQLQQHLRGESSALTPRGRPLPAAPSPLPGHGRGSHRAAALRKPPAAFPDLEVMAGDDGSGCRPGPCRYRPCPCRYRAGACWQRPGRGPEAR